MPYGVVTAIRPEPAPAGTRATAVSSPTHSSCDGMPAKSTAVAEDGENPRPAIVTSVPGGPLGGAKKKT